MSNAVATGWPSGSGNLGWGQEPTGMLMPGRVEGWPAGTQRAANPATQLLTQAVAYWDVANYRDGDRFLRNQGTGGELLDLRLGSSIVANSNDPAYYPSEDRGYVALPGVASNFLSVTHDNAFNVTDLDIRVYAAPVTWTPSAVQYLAAKMRSNNVSWLLTLRTDGKIALAHSSNGTSGVDTQATCQSTAAVGLAAGTPKWIRATLDVDNGAAGRTYRYFTSDDGLTWTQLGSDVTIAGTSSVFAGTANVQVGQNTLDISNVPARVYAFQVLDGIGGTTVLDIDCDAITSGSATSFTAVTNQTVTINRSTSGRKSVAVPSRFKGGSPVMLLGTDDRLEIPVESGWQHTLLNFQQGDSFTVVAAIRPWASPGASRGIAVKADISTGGSGLVFSSTTNIGLWAPGNTSIPNAAANFGAVNVVAGSVDSAARIRRLTLGSTTDPRTYTWDPAMYNLWPWRIGRATNYGDFEFYAAAVFRRTLSAAEVTALSNYFTGRIA